MPKLATFPLLKQLLLPLVFLLLILAITSVIGSGFLLHSSLGDSIDSQLSHAQQMVYQDLKQRELRLSEQLSHLSEQTHPLTTNQIEAEIRAAHPSLDLRVYDAQSKMSDSLQKLSGAVKQSLPGLSLVLFDQRKGHYLLTLIQPTPPPRDTLALQFPLTGKLLKSLSERYICDLSLYTEEGKLMASSNVSHAATNLSSNQLKRLEGRDQLYISTPGEVGYRTLLAPLPLGSDGLLILATSHSLDEINSLLLTHSWRLLLTVLLTLAIGSVIYYRLLRHSLTPLKNILETIRQVSQGNLSSRTVIAEDTHLFDLGHSFNQMLGQLETLYENRLDAEKTSVLSQETLKYNNHLKKKNLEIEKVNIQLKEQYEDLTALFQISRSLASSLDQNLLFEKIFTIFRDALHCDRIVLLLYHPGSESLEVEKTTGLDASTIKGLSFNLGEGISGMAAASMQPVYCKDLSTDDRNLNYKGRWVSSGSLLSMPMIQQNRLIGILNIHHPDKNAFTVVSQQMVQAIADQAAISIQNSRLFEKTRTLSATDDLTGLANRRQFQDFLQREWAQSRRYHSTFSLLMLDIDHFKSYNDTHGHLKGDIVLKKVASLLLKNTRGIDLVARFGGEEFVVLLPKADREGGLAVAQKLCACIEDEYFNGMESQPFNKLTVSIGTSTFPNDSTDIYELLNLADDALYQAKRNGRNHAVAWSREVSEGETEPLPASNLTT